MASGLEASPTPRDAAPAPDAHPAATEPAAGTVLVIDGDSFARRAIRTQIAKLPEVTTIIEAGDWRTGISLMLDEQPVAVVLELQPLQANPVEPLVQLLRAVPEAAVVVFSMFDQDDIEIAAIRSGARGFIRKQDGLSALLSVLPAVMRGDCAVSRRLTMEVIRIVRDAPESGRGMRPIHSHLTNREWEVLDLIGGGFSTRQIAEQLVLTEDTVYSHVKNSMRKLGVHTRAEAVALLRLQLHGES